MMRIGLLGASRIAPNAVIGPAARRSDVSVSVIAARDRNRASDYAARFDIPVAVNSYAALVSRDDVDVVYCALPPSAHLDVCLTALASGKMLLVEKPFAVDAQAATQIAAASIAAGRPALEAFHYRFHDQFHRALEIVHSGMIGTIVRADGVFNAMIPPDPNELRWNAACGGGATMDLGCYVIHALRLLLGIEPDVLDVRARNFNGVDSATFATLSFAGIPATMRCSMDDAEQACIVVEGTLGSVTLEGFVAPQLGGKLSLRLGSQTSEELAAGPTTYEAQLSHVVDVWNGRAHPVTGGEDAVATMRVVDACRTAGRTLQ